ncbi:DUF4395 domain-containing protein [Propionibacterium sp.]|uniref:DUF4395 domain-containing protein n=1 Tax=Propionibacterium sp. TaxID=1977903 RepID=UPI0039E7DB87
MPDTEHPTNARATPKPIDTRAPRYVGGYTFVLAIVTFVIALLRPIEASLGARVLSPEFILLFVLWLSFGAGTFFGNGAHPFAVVFRTLIRPLLHGKPQVDDPRPHRFALLVGFVLSTVGLVLHLFGVPYGLAVLTAFLIIASFLQAFVGLCLGCQVYLLLVRAHVIRPSSPLLA